MSKKRINIRKNIPLLIAIVLAVIAISIVYYSSNGRNIAGKAYGTTSDGGTFIVTGAFTVSGCAVSAWLGEDYIIGLREREGDSSPYDNNVEDAGVWIKYYAYPDASAEFPTDYNLKLTRTSCNFQEQKCYFTGKLPREYVNIDLGSDVELITAAPSGDTIAVDSQRVGENECPIVFHTKPLGKASLPPNMNGEVFGPPTSNQCSVRGWVVDAADPGRKVRANVYVNNVKVYAGIANWPAPSGIKCDSGNTCKNNWFNWNLKGKRLPGQGKHQITVKVTDKDNKEIGTLPIKPDAWSAGEGMISC